MEKKLKDRKVAILVTDGFEQVELTEPQKALEQAGAVTHIVSPEDYDALLLPGGVMNPDKLRRNEHALQFVRAFFNSDKPVAAICHGPWTLIDAGVVKGRRLTSYESIQTDLKNAGAEWVNEEAVVDRGLVTSRKPDDIPVFNRKMIEAFAEGAHQMRTMRQKGG
jgi:protease I